MKNKWGNANIVIYLMIFNLSMVLFFSLLIIFYAIALPALIIGLFLFSMFIISLFYSMKPLYFYWKYDVYYNNFNYEFWGKINKNNVSKVIEKFLENKKFNYSIQSSDIKKPIKLKKIYILNDFNLFLGLSNIGVVLYSIKKQNKHLELIKNELSNHLDSI
jgi:hypothetical protein